MDHDEDGYRGGRDWQDPANRVSPTICSFLDVWYAGLKAPEARKLLLGPLSSRWSHTAGRAHADARRGWLAMDWLLRIYLPAFGVGVPTLSMTTDALRQWSEINSVDRFEELLSTIHRLAQLAKEAAGTTDGCAAAYLAGGYAAWIAAGNALRDIPSELQRDMAYRALCEAVRDTTAAATQHITTAEWRRVVMQMQWSAVELVGRMCAVQDGAAIRRRLWYPQGHNPGEVRGSAIPDSAMFRDWCLVCGEAIRMSDRSYCDGRNLCLTCMEADTELQRLTRMWEYHTPRQRVKRSKTW